MKTNITMKFKVAGLALLTLALSGCEDFLTVPAKSKYTSENLFESVTQARMTAYGAYVVMAHPMYGRKVVTMCTTDTDEMRTQGGWETVGRRNFSRYSSSPASVDTELNSLWNKWYQCIDRCNICIDRIPKMDLYENGSDADKAELRNLHGEMLALRAMCYFDLIKHWGDVPFVTEPATADDKMYVDRTSRDVIYDYIINDLQNAVDLTQWRKDRGLIEARFTKGAVKGLLARICLHAAGYSLRWDLATGGNLGMRTRDDAARITELYTIARDQCRDVIQDPAANHRLNPSFEQIWKDVCNSKFDETFGESMFEIGMYNPIAGESTANGNIGNKIGAPCDKDSKYGAGGTEVKMMPIYYFSFDTRDVRRDVTVTDLAVTVTKDAQGNVTSTQTIITNRLWEYNPGKWRAWWCSSYMNEYTSINWIVMRYSDILLMFAEADNKLNGGPTPDAIAALRQVRARAYVGNEAVVAGETYPSDEAGFLNTIINERWWEFGAEAIRKYDLIRWNKLGERIQASKDYTAYLGTLGNNDTNVYRYCYYIPQTDITKPVEKQYGSSGTAPAGYTRTAFRDGIAGNTDISSTPARDFTANKTELYPIPQSICDDNPMLSQHPSYRAQ